MRYKMMFVLPAMLVLALMAPVHPATAAEDETLAKYVAELKKKPDAQELRARIISYVQSMKTKPATPDDAERALTRGNALLKIAADRESFERAIPEFQAAITAAPWLGDAYLSLATAQEKTGYFADAINSLNFYLLINSKAPNVKDIKKKIYELEVYAEQAHQEVPAPVKLPQAQSKKSDTPHASAQPEKKVNLDAFIGSWYSTDKSGPKGEEVSVHAFTIRRNTKGDLIATPPRRTTGTIGSITMFDISGRNLKLRVTWKLSSVPTYWKTEDFDLVLSDDESKLVGKYDQKSSGARSREFSEEQKTFTRQ
jgi:tetratricopeptide (TPR) repeat protein